jgi:hypothetical protein
MESPILYDVGSSGKQKQWQISVKSTASGGAIIETVHGQKGGKLQTRTKTITEGKCPDVEWFAQGGLEKHCEQACCWNQGSQINKPTNSIPFVIRDLIEFSYKRNFCYIASLTLWPSRRQRPIPLQPSRPPLLHL